MDFIKFFTTENNSGWKCVENKLKNSYPELVNEINSYAKSNNLDTLSFKEKIFHFINTIPEIPKCKTCNKELKFGRSISEGYPIFCCTKCAGGDINRLEKIKATNIKKYNVEYIGQSKDIQNKIKETNLTKYGVDNVFKSKEIQEVINETNIIKYGFNRPLKNEKIKEKQVNTNLKKYGVKSPLYLKTTIDSANDFKFEQLCNKYNKLDIVSSVDKLISIKCNQCNNIYTINNSNLHHRDFYGVNICTICNPIGTRNEKESSFTSFIKTLVNNVEIKRRDLMNNKQEIDIYLPDYNIGFEFDGLYWHSDKYTDKNYHLNKTKLFQENNIRLIHIFEDEWDEKQDIVKSRIKNIIGLTENKIYARKCIIKEVNTKDKSLFLDNNHIQGAVGSNINLGLYYDNELVSLMTFDKTRRIINKLDTINEYELIRFCNKLNTNVIGGASKLLNFFIKTYKPNKVISYADLRWSTGDLYKKLGFKFVHNSRPNFWYLIKNKGKLVRESRLKYQKHKLVKSGFDINKTAKEITDELGMLRIYDCGNAKYEIIL